MITRSPAPGDQVDPPTLATGAHPQEQGGRTAAKGLPLLLLYNHLQQDFGLCKAYRDEFSGDRQQRVCNDTLTLSLPAPCPPVCAYDRCPPCRGWRKVALKSQ